MPPFRYDDPGPNRYAGTILDLLRERGAIDASAAERIAGVRANADLQRGERTAQMIQAVAQAPGQIVQAGRERQDRQRNQQILVLDQLSRVAVNSQGDPARFESGITELGRFGILPKDVVAQSIAKVRAEGPDAIRTLADFAAQTKAQIKTREIRTRTPEGGERVQIVEDVPGQSFDSAPEVKPKPQPTEASLALDAAGGDAAKALEALQAPTMASRDQAAKNAEETARHNAAMERIGAMGAGRAEAAQRETERHNRAMEENARNTKIGRPVIAGNAEELADFDTSLDDLGVLRATIAPIDSKTGKPVAGVTGVSAQIGAAIPAWATDLTGWGTDAKKKQALIDRVKQVIGKTLEGGVLRKEDELKYEKILPTVKDTSEVVISKLNGLEQAIAKRKARRLDALEDAGYDVSRYRARAAAGKVYLDENGNPK